MKKSTYKPSELVAQGDSKTSAQKMVQDQICEHDWQPDGQTMTAVRWACTKCHKTKLTGLDI